MDDGTQPPGRELRQTGHRTTIEGDCHAKVMLQLLEEPPSSPTPPVALTNILAASDAGANDTTATVGGWYSHTVAPKKYEVHWF